jgi:hypothetical protein
MATLKNLNAHYRPSAAPVAIPAIHPATATATREEVTHHDPETGEVTESYLVDALVGDDDIVTHDIDEGILDAWLDATQALVRALYNDQLFGYIEAKDGSRTQKEVSDAHFFLDALIYAAVRQAEFCGGALDKNASYLGEVQSKAAAGGEIDMDKLASLYRFRNATESREDFWASLSQNLKSARITELGTEYRDWRTKSKPLSKQAGTELAAQIAADLARPRKRA